MSLTTDYPETTTSAPELYAEFIAAPASSMSPAAIAEHMQQNQITFEIPSAHDLRHIDALHSFNALLQRIGSAAAPAASASISTEQLSNSVVLDLADLRDEAATDANAASSWEQIFGDADMHAIINYLWIGVVTSLVVLSLVFILFSCYFYRKFRTWKKCNASRLLQQLPPNAAAAAAGAGGEAAFYQIESPPCYTIATGLPSYDEALHHQPRHLAYGMKFVYPSLAAVHHHHHHQHRHRACISSWEKDELQQQTNKLQKCKLSATLTTAPASASAAALTADQTDKALPAICINMPDEQHEEPEERRHVSTEAAQSLLPAAAADDDCASLVVVVAA
ncbi:comm [Drosophila busckii]|uniref:Comm n=1 Tax=Drosophila busckii TaxID=30019 RepID=A0A0M4F0P6_DROBS|nr:comm [Drosophila busckii]